MRNINAVINSNKKFHIINHFNIGIQTLIIYYIPHIERKDVFVTFLYIIYFLNYLIICPITRAFFFTYLYSNITVDIYYLYLYTVKGLYIQNLWYIIGANTANILYIYKYKLYDNIGQINNAIDEEYRRYNTGEIMLTDDESSSSSSSDEIHIQYTDSEDDSSVINADEEDVINADEEDTVNRSTVHPETVINIDNSPDIILNKPKSKTKDECVICFINFKKKPIIITKCGHKFHRTCLNKWLRIDNVCPICRERSPLY